MPEVLKDGDTRSQADYRKEEAVLQNIKGSSMETCERAVMTGKQIGRASHGLKAKAQKGKD